MAYQSVFNRYEIKYIINKDIKRKILENIEPYINEDKFGHTEIRNIYFDTENYRLIRRSIEKPAYKEKLRIRSYKKAEPESPVFVELKKKFKKVVYKRRISLPEQTAMDWVSGKISCPDLSQIGKEINYFIDYYGTLQPKIFLSYERDAYYALNEPDFRITFDNSILCRQYDVSLCSDIFGIPIIPEDTVLMELKCAGVIPVWMTRFLTENRIFKTSFSKYGTAYKDLIYPELKKAASLKICDFPLLNSKPGAVRSELKEVLNA